jgi:hypothetical protein
MSLNNYDYTKLLHMIKLISKAIHIIRDENNQNNRVYACGLAQDLVDLLFRDIKEMTEGFVPNEHEGHIKEGE